MAKIEKKLQKIACTDLVDLMQAQTMTSLQVASITGKNHKDVLRDIKKIETEFNNAEISPKVEVSNTEITVLENSAGADLRPLKSLGRPNFWKKSYKDAQNKRRPMYEMDFSALMLLLTAYSVKLRFAVIQAWQADERYIAEQKKTADTLLALRLATARDFRDQCDAVKETREALGKEIKAYHYTNEARLLNIAMTGKPDSIDRDKLSEADSVLLDRLEKMNASLIRLGADYDYRKKSVCEYAKAQRTALIEA